MKRRISVLIVDDSTFMRKALKRMLSSDAMIRVVGEAKDGREALIEVKRLKPDVVTLDMQMPGMDGLMTLKEIMRENPTPVLMVSSVTTVGGEITLKALSAGAVDFIDKSACHTNMDILDIADSLIQKVKIIAGVDLKKIAEFKSVPASPLSLQSASASFSEGNPSHLVLIGASTGGPMSLEIVIENLPQNYPGAILVVQHMPVGFTRSFAERLDLLCKMKVQEAREDDPILSGNIYIAPAGYHLMIKKSDDGFRALLSRNPRDTQHCPSVDVMLKSAAQTWPGKLLAIIMTGMGQDGTEGIRFIKERAGIVLAQNEETCVVYGMPKAAFQSGYVDRMVPLHKIGEEIYRFNL